MDVIEAAVLKILVNGEGQLRSNAVHGAKRVCSRTQVSDLAQELHRVTFLLQRECGVGRTDQIHLRNRNFVFLSLALGRHEFAFNAHRGACQHLFKDW